MGLAKYKSFSKLVSSFLDLELRRDHDNLGFESELSESLRYSLLGPGKMFRPVLSLGVAEILGLDLHRILPFAVALECIHVSSLIHDDLPALDNDSLRRGRATCHIQFGESTAILTGDAALVRAFRFIVESEEEDVVKGHWTKILCSAAESICYGQVEDARRGELINPAEEIGQSLDVLNRVHILKTAKLFSAASAGPALCGNFPEHLGILSQFGEILGLMFQTMDDILEDTLSSDVLGKDNSSDIRNKTVTMVSLLGLEGARQRVESFKARALGCLVELKGETDFLEYLLELVVNRKK